MIRKSQNLSRDIRKIKNLKNNDLFLTSADLMAVKFGIKKVARMEAPNLDFFKKTAKELKARNLITVCSDDKLLGSYNLYISRDKKMAMQAKNLDPSFKIINQKKTFSEIVDDVIQFSRLLSYPDCCINEYVNNTIKNIPLTASRAFRNIPSRISFLFNNLLNGVSNHYLSFHFPCFFGCRRTFDYQKKIFDAIRRQSPSFADEMRFRLRLPFLVFLNPSLSNNMYVSWDNRIGVIFYGKINGKELFYQRPLAFRTAYPDYAHRQDKNSSFDLVLAQIERGDRIVFGNNGFKIFKNRTLLYVFKNSKNFLAFFFNFV